MERFEVERARLHLEAEEARSERVALHHRIKHLEVGVCACFCSGGLMAWWVGGLWWCLVFGWLDGSMARWPVSVELIGGVCASVCFAVVLCV